GLSAHVASIKLALATNTAGKYTGLQITDLSGDLVGISALTFHVWDVHVAVNQGPVATVGIDWSAVTGSGLTLSDPAKTLSLSGNAQLSLAGFVMAQGAFQVDKTTLNTGAFLAAPAQALLVSLSDLDVFAGVGGV